MTLGRIETRWVRSILFLAVNICIAVLLVTGVLLPGYQFFAEREVAIAEKGLLLARLESIAAQEAHVRRLAQERGNRLARGEFLTGPNDGVITAELQTRLKGMIQAAGAQVRSVQTMPAKTDNGIKYLGSRIEVQGPIQAVHRAIHTLENAKPYLFVTGASLKLAPSAAARTGVPVEPVLQAQLDFIGAVQGSE